MQLIKFWPSRAPGRGLRRGENFRLSLTTASAHCLRLSERFFHYYRVFGIVFGRFRCTSVPLWNFRGERVARKVDDLTAIFNYLYENPRRRHDFETTAAVFYIWPARYTSRPSLYSRQAGVSGLWRQHLERSADTRDIRAVNRGLQTTSQDIPVHSFISEHFYLTYAWTLQ